MKKKEELKTLDVNVFLLENGQLKEQLTSVERKYQIASEELVETTQKYEASKAEYEQIQNEIEALDAAIEEARANLTDTDVLRSRLEGEINVLKEQINSANGSEEHLQHRKKSVEEEMAARMQEREKHLTEKQGIDEKVREITDEMGDVKSALEQVQKEISDLNEKIEDGKNVIIEELNQRATIKSKMGRFDTMMEQINIRKAELNSRLLRAKSDEAAREEQIKQLESDFARITEELKQKNIEEGTFNQKLGEMREKLTNLDAKLRESQAAYHMEQSKLEALTNLTERYEGYGGSIKAIMERRSRFEGICGVVADIIETPKEYETAIEIALGGNIQNIVTEDEETAKELIEFLKKNKFGRATFLPITSVGPRDRGREHDALGEKGVIGMADELVKTEDKYRGVAAYLLGRILVVESLDSALLLAKKYKYRIRMVTLEGELIQPGGSLTGGTFKNSANLLGRKREMDELDVAIKKLSKERISCIEKQDEIRNKRTQVRKSITGAEEEIKEKEVALNTAKLGVKRAQDEYDAAKDVMEQLSSEVTSLEARINEIESEKRRVTDEAENSKLREKAIEKENEEKSKIIEEKTAEYEEAKKCADESALEETKVRQSLTFLNETLDRIKREIEKNDIELRKIKSDAGRSVGEVERKKKNIFLEQNIKNHVLESHMNRMITM